MAALGVDRLAELQYISGVVARQEQTLLGALDNGEVDAAESMESAPVEAPKDTMEMEPFFAQIKEAETLISEMESGVRAHETISRRLLDATTDADIAVEEARLARTVDAIGQAGTRCRGLLQRLDARTNALERDAPPGSGDLRMRQMKTAAAMRRFAAAVSAFQKAQAENRRENRAALERQYRVMRPDADVEEVGAVSDALGEMTLSRQQVFALGTRGADPRAVLEDMRARRDDVMALERGIDNLARLFADMENMIAAQGAQLDSLEAQVGATLEYTEAARGDLRRARETQRNIKKVRSCVWMLLTCRCVVAAVSSSKRRWSAGCCKRTGGIRPAF